MRLPLSRTRAELMRRAKGFVFDIGQLQDVVDMREKHHLEDSMGFRGQFDEHRRFQFELLHSHGLSPAHRFLEIGCGPLTAGIPIIRYLDAGNYTGIDIRDSVLELAWEQVGKNHLSRKNPRLVCSTVFGRDTLTAQDRFDFIFSFSVLFHLSDDLLNQYFQTIARLLTEGGICLANVNIETPSDRWLEFPFLKRSVEDYNEAAARHGLSTTDLGSLKESGFRNDCAEQLNQLLRFRHRSAPQ
jgi:SAM-dependent methyltransferase